MATKRLYHFTALLSLPAILREGVKPGELPTDPAKYTYEKCPKAVNLTANGNANDQMRIWASGSGVDKTKIRLTIELPEKEIVTFRKMRETFKIKAEILDILAPREERPHWFYKYGHVSPQSIVRIELLDAGEYRELVQPELSALQERIEQELERAFIFCLSTEGPTKGAAAIRFKPGVESSWLLDAHGPALTTN